MVAKTSDTLECHVCGAKNPITASRCNSCGARLESLAVLSQEVDADSKRSSSQGFSPTWVMISSGLFLVLQMVLLLILPMLLPFYAPQGISGIMVAAVVFMTGGVVIGFVSPQKTYAEPAVAALIVSGFTTIFLMLTTPSRPINKALGDGFEPTMVAYSMGAMMGVMMAILGTLLGESLQSQLRRPAKSVQKASGTEKK